MITSSHEGLFGQGVSYWSLKFFHNGMDAALLGLATGSRAEARLRGAEGAPLRPLPTQATLKMPIMERRDSSAVPHAEVVLLLGSSPFVNYGTNAAEPHIRSPCKRLAPKFLIQSHRARKSGTNLYRGIIARTLCGPPAEDQQERSALADAVSSIGLQPAQADFITAFSGISPNVT
jgi:hypothetical protein